MNENRLRRKSNDAIESTVTKREDGLFEWHTACGTLVLAFDPDGEPDLGLAVQ